MTRASQELQGQCRGEEGVVSAGGRRVWFVHHSGHMWTVVRSHVDSGEVTCGTIFLFNYNISACWSHTFLLLLLSRSDRCFSRDMLADRDELSGTDESFYNGPKGS